MIDNFSWLVGWKVGWFVGYKMFAMYQVTSSLYRVVGTAVLIDLLLRLMVDGLNL